MMTLKDCTKAELLWIIDRLRNRGLYRLDTIIATLYRSGISA